MRNVRRSGSAGVCWLLFLLAACGDDSVLAPTRQDLVDRLFSPPRASEVASALEMFAGRRIQSAPDGLTIVDTRSESFADLSLVSYRSTDGLRIYGVIAAPKEPGSYPILLYNHGGDNGLSPAELNHPLAAGFVQVASSFRSEPVRWYGTEYRSDGPASPWDRDVDDALILFANARDWLEGDPDRAMVLGASRGGGVALLAAARRPDWFRGAIDIFGPTDLFDPVWRPMADSLAAGGSDTRPGMDFFRDDIVLPYLDGSLSLVDARLGLIRRSSLYFADRLPPVQIHHGEEDNVVPPSQSARLAEKLESLGSFHEYFTYPDMGHEFPLGPLQIPRIILFAENLLRAGF
jgi:dipeptidyl aminopeptidase/acylaminoacyl peptidase